MRGWPSLGTRLSHRKTWSSHYTKFPVQICASLNRYDLTMYLLLLVFSDFVPPSFLVFGDRFKIELS